MRNSARRWRHHDPYSGEAVIGIRSFQHYRLLGIAILVVLTVALAYWISVSRMVDMWSLGTYQHGWLVVPVVLFLLWHEQQHHLGAVSLRCSWLGVVATAVLVLGWIMSRALNVQAIEFLAVALLVPATFWALTGGAAASRAAFPLLLLVFAVPTGEFLVGPLMEITAWISTVAIRVVGVPVYREGMFISLPGGNFEVAEVCAGLRYLLAGLLVSMAFAYANYTGWKKRLFFVAVAVLVLILANAFRAFAIMIVASATELRWLTGDDHIVFGLVVFAVALIGLITVGARYADEVPGHATAAAAPSPRDRTLSRTVVGVLTLGLLAAGPISQAVIQDPPAGSGGELQLPSFAGCAGPAPWSAVWQPQYRGADQNMGGSYTCSGDTVHVWIAGYVRQQQGKELISSVNRVWPKDWRRHAEEQRLQLDVPAGEFSLREVRVDPEVGGVRLIWYWYQVGDVRTADQLTVKRAEAMDALKLRRSRAAMVAIAVESDEPEGLRERLQEKASLLIAQPLRATE